MANSVSLSGASVAKPGAALGTASAATSDEVKNSADSTGSPAAKARLQLNASIVQASLTVSIGAQDAPLSLVFKSALTGINEALKADYGDDAVANAVSQDNTPDGTAGRIVALSTGFFEAYKKQHPGQDDATSLHNFMDTVRGGMEKGFKEARDILQGLDVLGGDIASNIDQTYALVQQGYADFEAAHQQSASAEAAL